MAAVDTAHEILGRTLKFTHEAGREIWGYPKFLANRDHQARPLMCSTMRNMSAKFGPATNV